MAELNHNKVREALESLVFDAMVSGDPQKIQDTQRTLEEAGLIIAWCARPLRIEDKSNG